MLLPLLLAASTVPSAPAPRIVPDLLRQDPRIHILSPGGHLLPRQAKSLAIQVQSIQTVQWQVRAVDPRAWTPVALEDAQSGSHETDQEEPEIGEEDDAGDLAAMGLPPLEDADDVGQGKKVSWAHRGKVVRPRDSLTTWTFRLNLDSLSRLHPGKLVSLRVFALTRDFLPAIDSTTCDTARVEETFLVSRLGLYGTRLGPDSVEILAVDLDRNRPWSGVTVRGSGKGSRLERTATDGTARLAVRGSGKFWLGLAEGREAAILSLGAIGRESWSEKLQVSVQSNDPGQTNFLADGIRLFPYLVRGVHAPGDTVVVGCLVRGPGGSIPVGRLLTLRLCRANQCQDSTRLRVSPSGHLQWRPRLAKDASTGSWEVQVQSGRQMETTHLRVEEVKPPRMRLDIQPRLLDSLKGAWSLEFSAKWLSGRPAEGSSFEASVSWQDDSRAVGGSRDTMIRGAFDALGRTVFQQDTTSDSQVRWSAKLVVREAGGHNVEQRSSGRLRIRAPKVDSVHVKKRHVLQVDEILPERTTYAFPQEVSPGVLRVGDTAQVRWEAYESGLALRQVVQGDRILRQSLRNVERGWQVWKEATDSAWVPRAHMVVSFLKASPSGDGWVRANGRTVDVAPRDSGFRLDLLPDSVFHPLDTARVVVRNPTGFSGSMVVSAVDEGILMIDEHSIGDPSGWFSTPEPLAVSWWNGLGRCGSPYWREESQECSTTDGLLGEARMSGIGGMGLGAGGFGKGVSTRGGLRARTFLEANPMAWASPVLPLAQGDQTVAIPLGAYTGAVRVSVVAVSGMQATVRDTSIPVRAPLELKVSGPLVVTPGDTFEVATTLLARPGVSATQELAIEGPATPLDTLQWRHVLTGANRADHRTRLVATATGSIRLLAVAVAGSDTGIAPLAVDVKDDRNLSIDVRQEGLPGKGAQRGGTSGQTVVPTGDGQLLTFVPDDRFFADGLSVRLEATTTGILGMDRRLQDLIGYPHGCLEQTLSRAIPQLYLAELFPEMAATDREKARVFTEAAVAKLRTFQNASGLLSLWPGESTPHPWGSLWALDFLQEYQQRFPKADHTLRDALQKTLDTIRFEDPLQEAYRLALRSREKTGKKAAAKILDSLEHRELRSSARWMLARAWWRLGEPDRARVVAAKARSMPDTGSWRWGMQSDARDRGLELETLAELGEGRATDSLSKLVAADLASTGWATTHEMGAQFRALAKALGAAVPPEDSLPRIRYGKSGWRPLPLVKGRASLDIPALADTIQVSLPGPRRNLSVEVTRRGRLKDPLSRRDSGLALRMDSLPTDPVQEGKAFAVQFLAKNATQRNLTDLAATFWLPGGWAVPREQLLRLRQGWRHVDIRADRVVFHFDLASGASRTIRIPLVALQAGSYRHPEIQLEALYDAALFAGWKGKRVRVLP